jgi:hypothetical protein
MEFNDAILHETGERLDVPRRLREALSWSQLNKARTFWSFDPETNSSPLAVDCYQGMLYGSRFSIHLKKDQ